MSSIENLSSFSKKLVLLFSAIVLIIALIALFEVAAFLTFKTIGAADSPNQSLATFLLSKPKAFHGVDDYEELKKEWLGLNDCPQNRIIYDEALGFPRFQNPNPNCQSVEGIENGLRITTGQPQDYTHKIFVFGGSTVWGTGSTDKNTIPSILQKNINEISKKYKVFNYGFSTVTSLQELSKLKSTRLQKGDIVIFYDGGNDLWQGVVYGKPNGTIIGYNDTNGLKIAFNKLKASLAFHSYSYRLLAYVKNYRQTK